MYLINVEKIFDTLDFRKEFGRPSLHPCLEHAKLRSLFFHEQNVYVALGKMQQQHKMRLCVVEKRITLDSSLGHSLIQKFIIFKFEFLIVVTLGHAPITNLNKSMCCFYIPSWYFDAPAYNLSVLLIITNHTFDKN